MQTDTYSSLKILVLEEILGQRPTHEISHSLGFKFDKFKRWMRNEKILRWDEFQHICQSLNLDIHGAYGTILFADNALDVMANDIFFKLKERYAFPTNQALADFLKCHVSVVKRYTKGETVPDVETIFKLLGLKPNTLAPFLEKLFPEGIKHPVLQNWIDEDTMKARFETKFPISAMIEATISLESYKSRTLPTNIWLSEIFETPIHEIDFALEEMVKAKVIRKIAHDSYEITSQVTCLDSLTAEEVMPCVRYLNAKLIKLLDRKLMSGFKSTALPGVIAYRVAPASVEAINKINEILINANQEILKTLTEDENPRVESRVILLQTYSVAQ